MISFLVIRFVSTFRDTTIYSLWRGFWSSF